MPAPQKLEIYNPSATSPIRVLVCAKDPDGGWTDPRPISVIREMETSEVTVHDSLRLILETSSAAPVMLGIDNPSIFSGLRLLASEQPARGADWSEPQHVTTLAARSRATGAVQSATIALSSRQRVVLHQLPT